MNKKYTDKAREIICTLIESAGFELENGKMNPRDKIILLVFITLAFIILPAIILWGSYIYMIPLSQLLFVFGFIYGAIFLVCVIGMWQGFSWNKKRKAWKKLAIELGLNYIKGRCDLISGPLEGYLPFERPKYWARFITSNLPSIEGDYRNHHVEINLEMVKQGKGDTPYTRCIVDFRNHKGILMHIYEEDLSSKIAKRVGLTQDIIVGDPEFDQKFIIQGNNEGYIKAILDSSVRNKIMNLKGFNITISSDAAHYLTRGFATDTQLKPVLETLIDVVEKIEMHTGVSS